MTLMLTYMLMMTMSGNLKWYSLMMLLMVLTLSLSLFTYMPLNIGESSSTFIFMEDFNIYLIMLTLWISALMILSSMRIKYLLNKDSLFMFLVLSLSLILAISFMVNSMMYYYILFEASLIPTLILIMLWGYQPERLEAGLYLMLYTITASLPLLLSLLMLYTSYWSLYFFSWVNSSNMLMWLGLVMAFMVKMPMYLSHLWLPKAHVEAPVAGSMILAGVLLKLGAYGLYRIYSMVLQPTLKIMFISISLWGSLFMAVLCLNQLDMKALVAYASVSHMAMLIIGLTSMFNWGIEGAILMMIAHGLASSGLFALVNTYYEMIMSRSLIICSGLTFITSSTMIWWFFLVGANMAAPPTLNFGAEVAIMIATSSFNVLILAGLILTSFFSVCYSLWFYIGLHHGWPTWLIEHSLLKPMAHFNSAAHVAPTIILILMFFSFIY